MKYIRTKDAYGNEIIALFDDRPVEKGGNVLKFSKKSIVLRKGIVINRKDFDNSRQANTIDELCDEAVFFDDKNKPHYQSQEGNIWYLGAWLYTKTLRFGIFTDKGLIYVAKMNDEGELELI